MKTVKVVLDWVRDELALLPARRLPVLVGDGNMTYGLEEDGSACDDGTCGAFPTGVFDRAGRAMQDLLVKASMCLINTFTDVGYTYVGSRTLRRRILLQCRRLCGGKWFGARLGSEPAGGCK